MHEMSITRNIVAIVAEHAGGRRVGRVAVEIGKLSAIMPDAVRFCFDVCAEGTILDGATLDIVETFGAGTCRACGEAFALASLTDRCPACGSGTLTRSGGDDLKIKEFEYLEDDTNQEREEPNVRRMRMLERRRDPDGFRRRVSRPQP